MSIQKLSSNDKFHLILIDQQIWKRRFEEINNFEKYLVSNGTIILKFFLNVSKEEQRKRFLEWIDRPEKKLEILR